MLYVPDSSVFQWLLVIISYVIAEPNMRAIVQNLAATSLWEIGRRALGFWKSQPHRTSLITRSDFTETADSITSVLLAAIKTPNKGTTELTLKTQTKYQKSELTIKLKRD
jgi:hypothetical protein